MENFTKVNTQMTKRMDLVFILCKMEEPMKVGGMMESNMVLEHLFFLIVI
jgi:hypothetical protein